MSDGEATPDDGRAGTRLQAVLARVGVASRRSAEKLILAGRVSVNGRVVTQLGTRVSPDDQLLLDGQPIKPEARVLRLVLNKPPGYLCAMSDPHGRPLASSLFLPDIPERVYHVGRLDMYSCGLVMYTNDGDFAAKAGHPSYGLIKEYEVETDGRLHPVFGPAFEKGLVEGGEILKAERVEVHGLRRCSVWLAEGRNREIRRALSLYRLHARVLRRVAIGPVRIGDLPEGSWRRLSEAEETELDRIFSAARGAGGRRGGRT